MNQEIMDALEAAVMANVEGAAVGLMPANDDRVVIVLVDPETGRYAANRPMALPTAH